MTFEAILGMDEGELRKGPWLEEEDEQLTAAVAVCGDRRWDALAKTSGLRRSGKSCRLRWMNYLRPNLKHGNISADEERIIVELHEKWGNRWSKIARRLPGRTDNEIKNYWRSYLKKKEKECLINSASSGSTSSPARLMNDEWLLIKDDISADLTASPYETRLTEWMSNYWPLDVRKTDPKDEVWSYDILYSPEWISGDCNNSCSIWDISLWGGE